MGIKGLREQGLRQLTIIFITAAFLSGCLESAPPAGGGLAAGAGGNSAPEIGGNPELVAVMSNAYAFEPAASDGDGDTLSFSIRNKPAWASFDAATGRLEGIPQFGDAGSYDNISISVSDGSASASLPAFSIAVSQDGLGSVRLEWAPPQFNTDGTYACDLACFAI